MGDLGETDVRGLEFLPESPTSSPFTHFCYGNGSGSASPCGNEIDVFSGCENVLGGRGATLGAASSASVAAADLRLGTFQAMPFEAGLYFQGSSALNGGNGVPFGNGLLCVGTDLVRLETVTTTFTGTSNTSVSIAAAGGVSPGDTLYYQLWYRTPGLWPCGSGFNLSNAVRVDWTP